MGFLHRIASFVSALVIVFVLSPASAQPQKRVALVIGNSKYIHAPALANPANDARAVAKALGEIGFDVLQGIDLDRNGMEARLREFLNKANSASIALMFYAGHGMQVDSRNYLVPVDARLESTSDLNFGTVDLDRVLASLDDPARANIIILDACRDNPLARSFAARTRSASAGAGLAAYTAALGTGTLIAFSTAPGKVAADGQGLNSPFTEHLVKHLGTAGLEVRQMLTRVRADVAKATGEKQVPWDNSSLRGDVYLAGRTTGVEPRKDAAGAAGTGPNVTAQQEQVKALEEQLKKKDEPKVAVVAPPVVPALPPQTSPKPAVGVFPPGSDATPLSVERERALKPKDTFTECEVCPEMVVVPSGSFIMTFSGNPNPAESPSRVTFARPFAVGKFAVTFAAWDACVADGGCNGYRPRDAGWGRGNRPVIHVNWHDAKAYVTWLARRTGKEYRLLSEAEHQYVTRAGTTTPFWWGSSISTNQANYNGNYTYGSGKKGQNRKQTVPVDSFQPNPWGLFQVHGNVSEWTEDCYYLSHDLAQKKDGSARIGPGCLDFSDRIVRGGSYVDDPNNLRADYSYRSVPENRDNDFHRIGFRVARTLAP